MARLTFVKKARKDNPAVKKGESYYWWKFKFSGKYYSATKPSRSQLTQSGFLGQYYDIQDSLSGAGFSQEELQSARDDAVEQVRQMGEEAYDALSNMPDHLQESSWSGELLQLRYDSCEEWASEMESVDLDEEFDPANCVCEEEDLCDCEEIHWEMKRDELTNSDPGLE